MADFMSREREFRKLNEKLDHDFKRSTTLNKTEKIKDTRQNPLASICYDTYRVKHTAGSNGNNTDRFATYTKEKSSILNSMRKFGGGDCLTAPTTVVTKTTTKSTLSPKKISKTGYLQNRAAKSLPKGSSVGAGYVSNAAAAAAAAGLLTRDTFERKPPKNFTEELNSLSTSSHKSAPKVASIVYKNEKFTSSSSMDDIIKRNIAEPAEQEEDCIETGTAASTVGYVNAPPARAGSTQPMESLNTCGAKSSRKLVNTSSLIRFLKSKVALLEENQARNVEEMTQQKEAYEAMFERHKAATQQLDKALNRNSTLTEQLEKTNSQLSESARRCREQSQECLVLKKDLESAKRELKHLTLNYTNLEKRYARTKEETENLQKSCTEMRQSERDLKENFRREIETKNAEIKHLKKQRLDLFNAYKKQLFLIDNLRQQNVCLEQAKMIDFCEKEFSKILEWNLKA